MLCSNRITSRFGKCLVPQAGHGFISFALVFMVEYSVVLQLLRRQTYVAINGMLKKLHDFSRRTKKAMELSDALYCSKCSKAITRKYFKVLLLYFCFLLLLPNVSKIKSQFCWGEKLQTKYRLCKQNQLGNAVWCNLVLNWYIIYRNQNKQKIELILRQVNIASDYFLNGWFS